MPISRPLILCSCALVVLLAGCRPDEPPPVPETSAAAAERAPVAEPPLNVANDRVEVTIPLRPNVITRCVAGSGGAEKTTFAPGEPIELTLDLAEAPPELKVAARLLDSNKAVVARADVPAGGKQSVTVVLRQPVERGSYQLEGYWGGNLVCEHAITIE